MYVALPTKSLHLLLPLLTLLHVKYALSIINRAPSTSQNSLSSNKLGDHYLNKQHPLWVLEDQVAHNDYTEVLYTTSRSPYMYQQQQQRHEQTQMSTSSQQQQQQQQQLQQYQQQQLRQQRQQRHSQLLRAQQLHKWTQQPMHPQQLQRPQSTQAVSYRRPQPFYTTQALPNAFQLPRRIPLPNHYLPAQRRQYQQRKQPRYIANPNSAGTANMLVKHEPYIPRLTMPTFDSLPGDDSSQPAPIFIYNGPKGELILNTMLSAHKYPMQEPVPGQILYPPSVPIFRPRPIVERFRVPGSEQTLNLTLIPFYAHEAIDITKASRMIEHDSSAIATAAPAPTVLYAAPAPTTTATPATSKQLQQRLYREKKAKHYAAYRSPNEVHWQPPTKVVTTTPFPLAVANPLQNHRFADLDVEVTTPGSYNDYKFGDDSVETQSAEVVDKLDRLATADNGINDDDAHLHIIYVDESLEKPSTATKPPLLSSRYTLSKEYYAFPVFTLGKLLKPETEAKRLPASMLENMTANVVEHEHEQTTERSTADNEEQDNVDTWFILNSRYKGHHNHNSDYRLSSKYVQNSALEQETTEYAIADSTI